MPHYTVGRVTAGWKSQAIMCDSGFSEAECLLLCGHHINLLSPALQLLRGANLSTHHQLSATLSLRFQRGSDVLLSLLMIVSVVPWNYLVIHTQQVTSKNEILALKAGKRLLWYGADSGQLYQTALQSQGGGGGVGQLTLSGIPTLNCSSSLCFWLLQELVVVTVKVGLGHS